MDISMECLLEVMDDAKEPDVGNTVTWGVSKAHAVSLSYTVTGKSCTFFWGGGGGLVASVGEGGHFWSWSIL